MRSSLQKDAEMLKSSTENNRAHLESWGREDCCFEPQLNSLYFLLVTLQCFLSGLCVLCK